MVAYILKVSIACFLAGRDHSLRRFRPVLNIAESARPNLQELVKELRFVSSAWESIGVELDIEDSNLRQIESDYSDDSRACLREMLRMWLNRVDPPPSWSAIVEALDNLGYGDLSQRIKTII